MANNGSFEFEALKKELEKNEKIVREFNVWNAKFLEKMAQSALGYRGKIKDNTAIITGTLVANWFVSEIRQIQGKTSVDIGNRTEYASFYELGAPNVDGSWREGKFVMAKGIEVVNRQIPERWNLMIRSKIQEIEREMQ